MLSIYPLQEPLVTISMGGLKNYSTQKVIKYSDSTRKIVHENVFVFIVAFLILSQKRLKLSQKVTNFFSVCRLGNDTHTHMWAKS